MPWFGVRHCNGFAPHCTTTISILNNPSWQEPLQPESPPSTPKNQPPSNFFSSDEDEELTTIPQQRSVSNLAWKLDTSLTLKDNILTAKEFLAACPYLSFTSLFPPPPPSQPPIPVIPPNPCPPIPTPMLSTKPAKLQLGKPKAFNGSYETTISWMHSI